MKNFISITLRSYIKKMKKALIWIRLYFISHSIGKKNTLFFTYSWSFIMKNIYIYIYILNNIIKKYLHMSNIYIYKFQKKLGNKKFLFFCFLSTNKFLSKHNYELCLENLTNIRIKWKKIINYRNEKSIADIYVLSSILEIFDYFGNAKYFNSFDLICGF